MVQNFQAEVLPVAAQLTARLVRSAINLKDICLLM
jgi:hypothetical protein